jgi:hypothetical protein
MASPHVAGAVALLWSAHACFQHKQDDTQTALGRAALDLPGIVESCGGNYVTGPNNTWGNGRLDILAAVNGGCLCVTPGVPTADSGTVPGDNQVTVSWTAGSPPGDHYRIYRSVGACPGGTFALVRSGQSASPWTDTAVSGGCTYAYKVTAQDATGGCESAPSGCVSATATGACVLPPAFSGATCTTCSAPPPPVAETTLFSRGAGHTINVSYDAATCRAQKVIVLYNALGRWTGYAGCAQPDGGNSGYTTIDSAGQDNVWYNLVWTAGTTAGHPGFGSGGERTWNAGTLCGMTTDDHGTASCP